MKKNLMTAMLFIAIVTSSFGRTGLPFMKDNFPTALAKAKRREVPIFVSVGCGVTEGKMAETRKELEEASK